MPLFLPHFNLQKFNTLAVPASTNFFVRVSDDDEIREALAFAKLEELPILFLGGGSNLVLRDDFPGLVIHLASQGKDIVNENNEHVWLKVAAGENWHELVVYALNNAFYGLENLSLIPGSVGAAPIQNIGAYGVELKDVFAELTALDVRSGLSVTFTHESCRFAYRDSIFKNELRDQYVITSVTLRLKKQPEININYPALSEFFAGTPRDQITPQEVSEAVIQIRQSKLPDPNIIPNLGSFFKNPIVDANSYSLLKTKFPEIVAYNLDDGRVKLAAAWLIDRLGWRGKSQGGVAVHSHQALVLVNPQGLVGNYVLALAEAIQQSVFATFGVALELEPRVYP